MCDPAGGKQRHGSLHDIGRSIRSVAKEVANMIQGHDDDNQAPDDVDGMKTVTRLGCLCGL